MARQDYELPAEFLDAADRFVTLANEMGAERSRDWVRAVMMYATARYNAFCWPTGGGETERTADEAASYCAGKCRTMFGENVSVLRPVYRGDAPPERPQ